MSLVEVDAVDDALDRLVEGRVFENDVGGFATQFECQPLATAGDGTLDELADLRRARERDFLYARV